MRVTLTIALDAPTIAALRAGDAAAGKSVRQAMHLALLAQIGGADVSHKHAPLALVKGCPERAVDASAELRGEIETNDATARAETMEEKVWR